MVTFPFLLYEKKKATPKMASNRKKLKQAAETRAEEAPKIYSATRTPSPLKRDEPQSFCYVWESS